MGNIDVAGTFQVASGSVVGMDHLGEPSVLLGKNNHDSYAIHASPTGIIALVCDGCGTGERCEVGSRIGARLIAKLLAPQALRLGHVSFEQAQAQLERALERV